MSHTYLDMRTWYARSARQQSPQLEIGTQERHMLYTLPEICIPGTHAVQGN
jgi:hypothetical protein